MRDNLRDLLISYNLHNLFHYLWNNYYLLFLDNLLDNFLNNNLDLFDHLSFSLNISNDFFNDLNWLQLSLDDNLILLNNNWLLSFNYFFFYHLFRL